MQLQIETTRIQSNPSRTFIYEPDKRTFDGLLSSELRINLSWTDHAAELGCKAINSVGASISQRIKLKVECMSLSNFLATCLLRQNRLVLSQLYSAVSGCGTCRSNISVRENPNKLKS
ncbi:hypothetical protein X801_07721, partial [Opisthorchis viverrini]